MRKTALFYWLIGGLLSTHSFAFQLPQQTTKSYECSDCMNLSHDTIQVQWNVTSASLQHDTLSNAQKSFGYKKVVTAAELETGVIVPTDAPGAVIRITPLGEHTLPQLTITTAQKHSLNLKDASLSFSENEFQDSPGTTPSHQLIFQLNPQLGAGQFILHRDKHLKQPQTLKPNDGVYAISVYEKNSPVFLQVETDSVHYQYGDTVTAKISLNSGSYESDDLDAYVIDSNEQKIPLVLTKLKDNTFQGSLKLTSDFNNHGKNWHVEVDTKGGLIKRSGHCAFSYSIPSASLLQINTTSLKPLTFVTTVNVATASRYALQTVLFRKTHQGNPIPIKTIQKAQWLEPGVHQLEVSLDSIEPIKTTDLYVGYLRLVDYGQLKTVHQFDKPIKISLSN